MGMEFFIVTGMLLVELSACQVSNVLHCKLAKIAPFIIMLDIILGGVYDVINHFICIFYPFFKLKYLQN